MQQFILDPRATFHQISIIIPLAMLLHQLQMAVLVPDDSLLRFELHKKNLMKQNESFFIHPRSINWFLYDGVPLTSQYCHLFPNSAKVSIDIRGKNKIKDKSTTRGIQPRSSQSLVLCSTTEQCMLKSSPELKCHELFEVEIWN